MAISFNMNFCTLPLDVIGKNAFLESIRESEYYPLFYTLLYTGLRRS